MKTAMHHHICQTNARARVAVVAARLCPCIETRTELRDALAFRLRARSAECEAVAAHVRAAISQDVRTYGRQERTLREILAA